MNLVPKIFHTQSAALLFKNTPEMSCGKITTGLLNDSFQIRRFKKQFRCTPNYSALNKKFKPKVAAHKRCDFLP